jgi:N-acetylmuramoyl-L-alanine amidase
MGQGRSTKQQKDLRRLRNIPWAVSGVLGFFLLTMPAMATKLQYWRFDAYRNNLEFRTDQGVQPRAQLIANPTRLVIDLPGVVWGRPASTQTYSAGQIRSVRIGQFDPQTTRMVLELEPGYTLDPAQVKFRGTAPTRWLVQLPQPQAIAGSESSGSLNLGKVEETPTAALPEAVPRRTSVPPPTTSPTAPTTPPITTAQSTTTQVMDLQITPDGLYVSATGKAPEVEIKRSRNKRLVEVSVKGAVLSPSFTKKRLTVNRFGVKQVLVEQQPTNPSRVLFTFRVSPESPDWQASPSTFGGVALVPSTSSAAIPNSSVPPPRGSGGSPPSPSFPPTRGSGGAIPNPSFPPPRGTVDLMPPAAAAQLPSTGGLATVNAIDLGGDQLLIRSDQTLAYSAGWEGNTYRISLRGQFDRQLRQPRLALGSPLARIKLRQDNSQTISILVTPAPGVRIAGVSPFGGQSLLVQLQRADSIPNAQLPDVGLPPTSPSFGTPAPNPSYTPNAPLPTPIGRKVVVIDPGHGGQDPGAVGIGGLQEKEINLDISLRVAAILSRQGVTVVLTRRTDLPSSIQLELQSRVSIAERARADAFVSIHSNAISMSRPDVNGLQVFYAPGGNSSLARAIHSSVLSSINTRDRGLRTARFYVIRRTSMPAALVETGYVTGAEDARNFMDSNWREQMAQAIARGILNFLR